MAIDEKAGRGGLLDACDRLVGSAEARPDGTVQISDVRIGLLPDRARAVLDAAEDCAREFERALEESLPSDVKHFSRGLDAVGQTVIWTLSAVKAAETAGDLYLLGGNRFSRFGALLWSWRATRRRKGALKWARSARALAGIALAKTPTQVREALADR